MNTTRKSLLAGTGVLVTSLAVAGIGGCTFSGEKVAIDGSGAAGLSRNKQTVQKYMDAFGRTDHAEILSCLTDDVEWVIPGAFHISGKDAFDREIENDAFVGSPTIRVTRMTEENDVLVAEGQVTSARKDGGRLNAVFCDVFEMQGAKIRKLTSYLMEIKE